MSRLSINAPLRSSEARIRLPSAFLPSSRQVFADRVSNPLGNLSGATASILQSTAGVAVGISRDRQAQEDRALQAQFESARAEATRLQGELSRTKPDDPAVERLAARLDTMDTRLSERFQGTPYEAEAVGLMERTRTQVHGIRQSAEARTQEDARLAARGLFRRQITQHVRELTLDPAVLDDYVGMDPLDLDDAVEQDFLSAMPTEIQQAVMEDPQLAEEFYRQRDSFVASVDSVRTERQSQADEVLAQQAEREKREVFLSSPRAGLDFIMQGVPEGDRQRVLTDLTTYVADTLTTQVPDDDLGALRRQRIAVERAQSLQETYTHRGHPELAQDLSEALGTYYANQSHRVTGLYAGIPDGEITEEVIGAYEAQAVSIAGRVLEMDTAGVNSVTELRDLRGPNVPEAKFLSNLVTFRRQLEDRMGEAERGRDKMARFQAGSLNPADASPDLLLSNYVGQNPEDTLNILLDRARPLMEEGIQEPALMNLTGVVRQARQELAAGELSPETQAELAVMGSYTDGLMNAQGKTIATADVADNFVEQIAGGNSLGIRSALAYMRGTGEHQHEFLENIRTGGSRRGSPQVAYALAQLSKSDPDSLSGEDLEAEYTRHRERYNDFRTLANAQGKSFGDVMSHEDALKGLQDRAGAEFTAVSRDAQNVLFWMGLPDQTDDLELAAETMMDRARQYGYVPYVENNTLRLIQDAADSRGRRATPAAEGVNPTDLSEQVVRPTAFSRQIGGLLYDDMGDSKTAGFSEALADWFLRKRPSVLPGQDRDRAVLTVKQGLESGQIIPRFTYGSQGVSLTVSVIPTREQDGQAQFAEPFESMILPNIHWGRNIAPNWRSRYEKTVKVPELPIVLVGEGIGQIPESRQRATGPTNLGVRSFDE